MPIWATGGAAAVGAGTSLYGANKQAQSVSDTNAANQAAIAASNQTNWNNYLLQRGLNTGGATPTGQIPTSATAANTRLPLWANFGVQSQPGALTVVRKGTPAPAPQLVAPTG